MIIYIDDNGTTAAINGSLTDPLALSMCLLATKSSSQPPPSSFSGSSPIHFDEIRGSRTPKNHHFLGGRGLLLDYLKEDIIGSSRMWMWWCGHARPHHRTYSCPHSKILPTTQDLQIFRALNIFTYFLSNYYFIDYKIWIISRGMRNSLDFLFTYELCSLDNKSLLSSSTQLEMTVKNGQYSDVGGKDLHI